MKPLLRHKMINRSANEIRGMVMRLWRRSVPIVQRMMLWCTRHPTTSVALVLVGIIAFLLGPVLWLIGGWTLIGDKTNSALDAFNAINEHDKKVEAYSKLISAIGLLAAAPVGLLGVGLAFWRTWNQHRDGVLAARKLEAESYAKATEAFAKAIEQLGSDKASVRMGAALALEALGKATPRLLPQAIEILCAFVRESWLLPSLIELEKKKTVGAKTHSEFDLIIDVIKRLKNNDIEKNIKVNLSFIDLSYKDLSRSSFRSSSFYGSDLSRAFMPNCDMSGSNFSKANLSSVTLSFSKLETCFFSETNMSGAILSSSNLSGAWLIRANLSRSYMAHTNLAGASLGASDLSSADLTGADLSRADLTGAKIDSAKFDDAVFSNTTLPNGRKWTGIGQPPAEALEPAASAPPPSLSVV